MKGGRYRKRIPFGLTPRELKIVSVLVKGTSGKEMTECLKISENALKHRISSIFDKLGVSTRMELVLVAINYGLLKWHEPKA